MQLQYNYSATQNNGQITQAVDSLSGETVDYTYDSLNRLITAATTGPQWGLSFGYDGFGNRLTQTVTKGTAPASSLTINASTNRISSSGYGYDSNGNLTTMPYGAGSMTLTYDIENRLIQATNSNGTETYGYSPDNRRVYQKQPSGTQLIHFYGANGDRLRTYTYYGNGQFQVQSTNRYFAGRLLAFTDRLGSVRGNKYLPYGEEVPATANDTDKFATYFRDSSTGLDYAMNRYYGSNLGRFLTPDPFEGSPNLSRPSSWNRYVYVEGDPVNLSDPSGLKIELQFTNEGDGICHALLRVTPESQTAWKNDPTWKSEFKNQENDKWYLTIGAGPTLFKPDTLVADLNRKFDVKPHGSGYVLPSRGDEDEMIRKLLSLNDNYADNLDYQWPGFETRELSASSGGYNSNSYISGLITAAYGEGAKPSIGLDFLSAVGCTSLPGWNKPVPPAAFFLPQHLQERFFKSGPNLDTRWNPFPWLLGFPYSDPKPSNVIVSYGP